MSSLWWDPNEQYASVTFAAVINFWSRLSVSGNVWLAACFIVTAVVLIYGLLQKIIFRFGTLVPVSAISCLVWGMKQELVVCLKKGEMFNTDFYICDFRCIFCYYP